MSTDVIVLCFVAFLVVIVVWIIRAAARAGAEPPRVRNDDTVTQLAMWSAMNSGDASGGGAFGDAAHHQSDADRGRHHGFHDGSSHAPSHDASQDGHSGGHDARNTKSIHQSRKSIALIPPPGQTLARGKSFAPAMAGNGR